MKVGNKEIETGKDIVAEMDCPHCGKEIKLLVDRFREGKQGFSLNIAWQRQMQK